MNSHIPLSGLLLSSLLSATLAFGGTGAGDTLTVMQSVHLALENQPLIAQASEQIRAASARVTQQQSPLYPQVEAEASYTRLGPVSSIIFPGLGEFELFPPDNYDAHVGLGYTLFDFGKRGAAIDAARSFEQSAEDNVALVKSAVAFQTIRTFYSVLFLRQSIQVKNDQIDALEKHLQVAEQKLQSGSATDFDVLTTQVRVAAAQSQRIDLTNAEEKAEILLARLMGFPPGTALRLGGDISPGEGGLQADSLVARALSRSPEIKLAVDAVNTARLQKNVASLGDMPSLNVGLSYGLKNAFFPDPNVLRGNFVAGVEVHVPVFNGHLTGAREEEAEALLRASEARRRDQEQSVNAEVRQALSDLSANLNKLRTAEVQVDHASHAVARADVQYQSGVITNLDLLDAETALAEARLLRLQVLYDSIVSRHALEKSVGDVVW